MSHAEQIVEAVLRAAPAMVWEYDPSVEAFTYVSDSAEALLGYSRTEWLTPSFWEEHIHPLDRAATVSACRGAFARGEGHTIEYRLIARSGREVFVRDQVHPVTRGDRRFVRGLMLDVTGFEEARVRADETLRVALEAFDGVLAIFDGQARLERLFGHGIGADAPSTEALKPMLGELTQEDRAAIGAALQGEVRRYERTTPDGRRLWVCARPLTGSGRSARGALLILRDVTTERSTEALHIASDRLATIGSLAASVAHEIRNPLAYATASIAFLDAELRAIESGRRRMPESLTELLAAVAEVREGIEQIQHVSTGLTGYASDHGQEPCDLGQVIARAVRFVAPSIGSRARIESELLAPLRVRIGTAQLQQVLVNLVMNGFQAAGPGARIHISAVASGGRVRVHVDDNGPGIPEGVLPRIFDRFFTTKPPGVGTGLGLPISRDILTAAGGALSAENRDGGGARFTVELPLDHPA